jgi:hypothetical protein
MSGMIEQQYGQMTEDTSQNAITDLDRQIERLQDLINLLEARLMPVSRGTAASEKVLTQPQAAPSSPLQGRAQTLGDQCAKIDRIIYDLDI